MTLTIYGIKNCDTCRKALKWLEAEGVAHDYHDLRADGLTADAVAKWSDAVGWEVLLNRRGTTWRKLPEADKAGVDATSAAALMVENPTLIKRPVFDTGRDILVGFAAETQAALKGDASGA